MKTIKNCTLFLIACMLGSCSEQKKAPWNSLFDGTSLNGWHIKNGTASYTIENNEIIGTTRMDTPNTFLCTDTIYSDFILEFEVKVDTAINSGVQIRSNSIDTFKNGKVHGYQIEIDPSKRAWSGGIYDEGRRGWIYNLENNEAGKKAFKNNEYNSYRVEAIKNNIRVWVNGINTANLQDDMTSSGFIGLQVHGIGNRLHSGKEIRWRNIRIITKNPELYVDSLNINAPLIKL